MRLCAAAIIAASSAISAFAQAPAPAKTIMARPAAPTVSLSPAVVQAKGQPGQTLTETLTLSNQTEGEFPFEMIAQDVLVRDGKRVFVAAGQTPNSIAQSAVFTPASGVVKPFGSATVTVRLTVPAGTPIRAVVAIFKGSAPGPNSKNAVSMIASLGALITFNLSNDVQVSADPVKVTPASESANLTVVDRLKNTGSEPAVVTGVAAVLNGEGKLVAKVPFTSQRLLPGEQLEFKAEYPSELQRGSYRVLCTFDFEGKQFTNAGTFNVS